jgi:hypothetical protein
MSLPVEAPMMNYAPNVALVSVPPPILQALPPTYQVVPQTQQTVYEPPVQVVCGKPIPTTYSLPYSDDY